ncbi:amidase [Duganella sp. FT92W]|uniref:Amidase n=1 Tax=Pseudoduganella rivuli TaxID=2666085 RepID=A0A7X2IL61_9BURK|nr:amidase [Pseudoduganella rivuli]MRV71890.1 amidase [Pseudoduganella rivuli]
MDRRDFVRMGLAAGAAAGLPRTDAAQLPPQPSHPAASPAPAAVAATPASMYKPGILDAGIMAQQELMAAHKLTSHALTSQYLARIKSVDKSGPRLNAVIELNPEALKIALDMDRERLHRKVRGPLHGIPVLIKDNIATGDRMCTTAGSLALAGVKAARDACLVARLRAAGAVILGKTNLSEWANMRSSQSVSGWSARGGLTRNPYALDRNCSGSSSGSAAAVAAALATIAVGTETDGSIVSPASICGLVGIKPTLGLVSRSGIIPIAQAQDTAGPMARSVADAALMLTAMVGCDPDDPVTESCRGRTCDYAQALDTGALRGKRLGVARNFFGHRADIDAQINSALQVLQAQGAILIDVQVPNTSRYDETEVDVLLYEFKAGLASYLKQYAPDAAVQDMAAVIEFNRRNSAQEMPYFGQDYLERAQAKGGLDEQAYRDALAHNHRYARDEGIDQVLAEHQLDGLVAPTGSIAWLTDFISGDNSGMSFSSPAAVAGYPHITVPAGYVHGLPVGLSLVGAPYSDASLIGMAYAFEQATHHRKAPQFPATISPGMA